MNNEIKKTNSAGYPDPTAYEAIKRADTAKCENCGRPFLKDTPHQKYCESCTGVCIECGELFVKKSRNQRYCDECRKNIPSEHKWYETEPDVCPICGKTFTPAPDNYWKIGKWIGKGDNLSDSVRNVDVCSYSCMRKWEKEQMAKEKANKKRGKR